MKITYLYTGLRLILNDAHYRIIKIIEGDICYLERAHDLALISKTKKELVNLLSLGQIDLLIDKEFTAKQKDTSNINLKLIAEDDQSVVSRRYKYVKTAQDYYLEPQRKNLEWIIEKIAEEIDDISPPSAITVYRWWKRWYDAGFDLHALIDQPSGSKGARKFKGGVVADIFFEVVNEVYLTKERVTKQGTYEALMHRIREYNHLHIDNIPIPSRSTVYRMINELDDYTVVAERHGIKEAEKVYRISGKGVSTGFPLERVEIDHTPLDIMVIDEVLGLTIGRPYLTCILDSHTRMPLALEIDFEPPSELSVMRALRQAIWPKQILLEQYTDINKDWPAYGIPSLLVCDNGLEFHSKQLRRVCGELNIELMFCPKHKPYYKGRVERFLGTLNRQVSQRIKGTTFSNISERGDYNSVEEATITLKELRGLIYFWAVEIYMQTKHRSINATPHQKWLKGLERFEPLLPSSRDHFDLICAKEYKRKLSHEGILFKHLFYNSEALRTMRILYGNRAKVNIRVNTENLEKIWVHDPDSDTFIEVPCIDEDYVKNLSLFQHTMILKERRAQAIMSGEEEQNLAEAKEKLRQSIQALSKEKKIKKRSQVARIGKIPKGESHGKSSQAPKAHFEIDAIPDFAIMEQKEQGNA